MADWSELMRRPLRDLRIGGSILFGSGESCLLDGEIVFSLSIDEGAGAALQPGCVISAQCCLDLVNDEGQWNVGGRLRGMHELIGATIAPQLGAVDGDAVLWHDLGYFQVESALCMEDAGVMRLQGQDSIASELAAAFADGLVYPQTLRGMWYYALRQTRYTWQGDVPNGSAVIDFAPDWKGASIRSALGFIAAAMGCFVLVNRRGELELKPLWRDGDVPCSIDGDCYLSLQGDALEYGPVDALKISWADSEDAKTYRIANGGLHAVEVADHPLFCETAPGLDALAGGMLNALAGFRTEALRFEWRGDPELCIGDRVELRDLDGRLHSGVVSRQSLRFDGSFHSSCVCDVPAQNNSGVHRAITPEGGLNAAALTGAVDGALLRVGSVTTEKLASGSITAEKIAAGAVDAAALEAVTARIEKLTAQDIATDRLAAAMAAFTVLTAGTAEFDQATIAHLVTQALNLEFGTAGEVFIRNLYVAYGQMVSATIGNLVIQASDGKYYAIDVSADGAISATAVTVSPDEAETGQTDAGRVILAMDITADRLNTSSLMATWALVNRIDAARIDVDQLWARQAFIEQLETAQLSNNGSIQIISTKVDEAASTAANALSRSEFQRVVRIDEAGLHVGDNQASGEVLIDTAGVHVRLGGRRFSSFAADHVEFGNYQLRRTADGGLAFKMR